MRLRQELRIGIAGTLAAALLAAPNARALVSLNDGRDRIYVSGTVGVAHDSNVFASADSDGDFVYSTTLSAEYTRRAGWIGVNANIGVSSSKFASIGGQDFADPTIGLEFNKQTGRTTGTLTLSAARQSRADPALNTRLSSWNYNAGLGFRYPIVGTYTLAGNLGTSTVKYADTTIYSDLTTYYAGVDLFHILSSERDVVGGYRWRYGETSRSTSFTDHSFTAGVSGRIVRGVNGSLRAGYQVRYPRGGPTNGEHFGSWTASGSMSYAISKKMNFAAIVAKDFSTTANESFVDNLTASLDAQYAFTSRWSASAGVAWGDSRFLGEGGRILVDAGPPPVLGPNRRDTNFSWNVNVNYSLNEHLKLSAAYTWFQNWSTLAFADFVRSGYSLSASTRW